MKPANAVAAEARSSASSAAPARRNSRLPLLVAQPLAGAQRRHQEQQVQVTLQVDGLPAGAHVRGGRREGASNSSV